MYKNASLGKFSGDFSVERGKDTKQFVVHDGRDGNKVTKKSLTSLGLNYSDFNRRLREKFGIQSHEGFVVTTTDRTVLDSDKFGKLKDGINLYLLQTKDQPLPAQVEEQIKFEPHYDTLIRAGMYEYYASDGKNPLPYALAELIDNSLSATAENTETRTVEIRLMFDETPAVIVLDNGCGMTPQQLNNWAVYRLSKFIRHNSTFASAQENYVRPDAVPRSLNSDISYFGVGGKQAAFYIGTSTRMISKSAGSPDVHELVLSKSDFERKEINKKDIYNTTIKNRKPCDSSHVNKTDGWFLSELIAEEKGKESFTAVVITDVQPDHITYLKQNVNDWTRQLAHVYHYYIHGVNGNDTNEDNSYASSSTNSHSPQIDIQVTVREKLPKLHKVMNLREVEDDMQSLYIKAAADTFEFKACVAQESGGGTVEGILRYHPYLYHEESYPQESSVVQASHDSDEEDYNDKVPGVKARGNRPIFECFWNGRLIPYTRINELSWCAQPKGRKLPPECYSRFSGVLFTDDKFEVSTNKLTFTDLEVKLKKSETIFTRVHNQKALRTDIQKKFTEWLENCHKVFDKQVKFSGYKGTIRWPDSNVKKMQFPWSTFSTIDCGGRKYNAGQLIKSKDTKPIYYGRVLRFLLKGEHKNAIFATGGEVEMALEPKGLYDKNKIIPISKIDQLATDEAIKKSIDSNSVKLPYRLQVGWPDANPWSQNDVRPAGDPLGPIKVEILSNKGTTMLTMPSVGQSAGNKLIVRLTITYHGNNQKEEVASFTAQHTGKHGFWFKKNENLTKLGKYTLDLHAMINEETIYGGKELPSYVLTFTIEASGAYTFVIDPLKSSVRVGVPFNLRLQTQDYYGHPTRPPPNIQPVLQCSDLDLTYEAVDTSGTTLIFRSIRAVGKVQQSKVYNLTVGLLGLAKHTKAMSISVLPGPSHSLHVKPKDGLIIVENGNPIGFNVEVHDEAGNITACPKHVVHCQVEGFPPVTTDCSRTGAGQLETKPVNVRIIDGKPQKLEVLLNIPSQKNIASVVKELLVTPSTRVSAMKLYSKGDENLVLKDKEKIEWLAGGCLENLFYELYDEAGRKVPLTSEIASNIKVTWKSDLVLEGLVQGMLPDVLVPTRIQEERFNQVLYQDQSVSVSFTIIPRPDEPARLKTTLVQSTVKLGETLAENIELQLVDRYDNVTRALNPTCIKNMTVTADGLDQSAVKFIWQGSSCSIKLAGVCFLGGTPGPREMLFTYGSFEGRIVVTVIAGDPAVLKLISQPDQPLQVLNDHSIPTPFVVQLFDKWGNPSSDDTAVVAVKSSPSTLKLTAATSHLVDADRKVSFTVTSVSGPKGYYQLMFTGSLNSKPIPGPSVNLIVLPDPNKPVSLSVEYDTSARFPAGGTFPLFSVTVVSDEGSAIATVNLADISMLLWEDGPSETKQPMELKCCRPLENERKDCFYFRDKEIPEHAGKYTVQFCLRVSGKPDVKSEQININVVAGQPVRLRPDSLPPPPVVSCSKDIANRILVEKMTLRIMDAYGNTAGQDLDGTVVASITNSAGAIDNNLRFESRSNRHTFKLVEGKVQIPRLAIMQDCPGEDGCAYTLLFKPEMTVSLVPLDPFELQFHFYNDEANQKKMCKLSKKKEELTDAVSRYSEFFEESNFLLKLLTDKHNDANRKVSDVKNVLDKKKLRIAQTDSITDVKCFIREKMTEAEETLKRPRRVCSIPDHFRGQADVLGVVGHLAYVEDDAAAWVISWHIRGDMDCVIARTSETAMRIYEDTRGNQQLMALDTIFVQEGIRLLPHMTFRPRYFHPPGNPVFATELLMFPENPKECDIVFKNILGNTIVMDDLKSANCYRKEVAKNKIRCPTILTRKGERVSANGKFGGAQNRAPPINTLKVFGAPTPCHYHVLKDQIDLAHQYQSALEKCKDALQEREDHLKMMKSPETLGKKQDMEEKKKELEIIERELASTPVRPVKRGCQDSGETSGINTKRPKNLF